MADIPVTPYDFAELGNSLLAAKDRMLQFDPESWAHAMVDPKAWAQDFDSPEEKIQVIQDIEATRSKLTRGFLFPLIKAASEDQGYTLLQFILQVVAEGLSVDDLLSILVTALEFDRANALFKMQIVRDVSPSGMFWSADGDYHKAVLKKFEVRSPYVAQHRASINKKYVQLYEAMRSDMGELAVKIYAAMTPLLEFQAPQWILNLE